MLDKGGTTCTPGKDFVNCCVKNNTAVKVIIANTYQSDFIAPLTSCGGKIGAIGICGKSGIFVGITVIIGGFSMFCEFCKYVLSCKRISLRPVIKDFNVPIGSFIFVISKVYKFFKSKIHVFSNVCKASFISARFSVLIGSSGMFSVGGRTITVSPITMGFHKSTR